MARTNKKTVVKNYDSQKVNGWELTYEYESENGAAPIEVKVTGQKDAASLFINRNNGNTSVNFSGGDIDADVLASVVKELGLITEVKA